MRYDLTDVERSVIELHFPSHGRKPTATAPLQELVGKKAP